MLRGVKIMYNFFGNSATITALPNDALRVKLSRHMRGDPGSHAFLWVPAIRWSESHPFTLVSSTPSEFVVRVYDGFTRDLYETAQDAPEKFMRCSVDGPYGQVLNFKAFDKVVLLAGGSGASFTFAIALDLIEAAAKTAKSIDFVWVMRHQERLEWFAQQLKQLLFHPEVNVIIHVTTQIDTAGQSLQSPVLITEKVDVQEKGTVKMSSTPLSANDLEKGIRDNSANANPSLVNRIRSGRPDIESLITAAATSSGNSEERIIVGACGPRQFTTAIQTAVDNNLLTKHVR